jgi:hypothetical protein
LLSKKNEEENKQANNATIKNNVLFSVGEFNLSETNFSILNL